MSTGTIIAIAIVVLSILLIIVAVVVTLKNIKPTIKQLKETNEVVNQKIEYFNREAEHLTNRVEQLNQRVELVQADVEVKAAHFEDFTNEQGKFQTSIRYLQGHAGEYASGIGNNLKKEIKEDGPKLYETFKRAFKKTAQKQKIRLKK